MAKCMIMRRVGGGGSSLNFKVLSGVAQPTNPTENTIWINTSVTITSWQFTYAQPSIGMNGMMWVQVTDSSTLGFNALDDDTNSLYTYPSNAKLYTGGAWMAVEAYIYQNSTWTQFASVFGPDSFSYTGTREDIDDGSGNWRIKLTSSGTLTCSAAGAIDIFCVGGGAGGYATWGGGGGGGRTCTCLNTALTDGQSIAVTIGAGGAASGNGGTTSFGALASASGGDAPTSANPLGGNGGSGGGAGGNGGAGSGGGAGGSDGGNGATVGAYTGGTGQGTTTREFGEPGGTLYAGGGAGNGEYAAAGGSGGGGSSSTGYHTAGNPGTVNTGGGGASLAGTGGSGIIVIRNKR